MPPRNKNDNPIQSKYEDKFNAINKAEKNGTADNSDLGDVKNTEESPNNSWKNNVSGPKPGSQKSGGVLASLKKKGPITAIILTLVGGGIGIGGLLSPSLLLVNLKEVMVNKFNTQLTSMDIRTTKLLTKKMNTTSGVCTSVVSVGCKYSTMSKKQVENFKKAGIDIEPDGKTMFGRTKPKSFKFEGKDISAKGLSGALKDSPSFRSAIKQAYNPKFAGFSDSIWSKAASKLKISKLAAKLTGKTDAERLKSVQDATKTDIGEDPKSQPFTEKDINPATKAGYTAGELAGLNTTKTLSDNFATDIYSKAKKVVAAGQKSALGAVTGAISSGINSTKITGFMDNACTAYTSILAVGYAAKTVRALQLASYAILFLNVADQIKAGTAKSEDVAYLGGVLTAESAATKKSATASFGYNFAAYGTRGAMPDSATQYLAGGGLTGSLIGITSLVNLYLGNAPKTTCKVLNNPFVGAASFGAGLVSLFSPAAPIGWGKLALQAAQSIAIGVAISFLPALLQDIVAGVLVDKTTIGEDAGDAVTSGASGIMSTAASTGGNAPLTPTQAVAYNGLTQEIAAQYAEEDRLAYSPFDITNSNTFLGSIVARLIPYTSNMSSLSGVMSSIASMTSSSFATIATPTTKATSVDDYTMCQDYAYNDIKGDGSNIKLATDPYCNVAYGIPPEYLDADPVAVADALIKAGEIRGETDSNGEAGEIIGTKYKQFITDCIDRTIPLGDSGSGVQESDGSNCIANDSNKNFYIYYIDQRVQTGMDGEVQTNSSTPTGGSSVGDSEQPADTKAANKGWTLKDSVDYSGVPCAEGSTDKSTYTHPTKHFTIRLCDTKLGKVSSLISQRVVNMVNAAKKDGVNLAGSSWRSYEAQQQLRADNCSRGHCSPPTASPGNSQHERGIGTDFGAADKGGAVWNWLEANGAKYGYHNLPSENWHWSMSGG